MSTSRDEGSTETPAERAARLKDQLKAKLDRATKRAQKLAVAESLSEDKDHEDLQQKYKDSRALLHRIRIEIARKRTSIKAHQRKIAQRESEIAKLMKQETDGELAQNDILKQIAELEKHALKDVQK